MQGGFGGSQRSRNYAIWAINTTIVDWQLSTRIETRPQASNKIKKLLLTFSTKPPSFLLIYHYPTYTHY